MDKVHYIKLQEKYCNDIVKGAKTFELRYNDRNYHVGDFIIFKPVDSDGDYIVNPIMKKLYCITYMLRHDDFIGLQPGYVILGIEEDFIVRK